MAKIVESPRGKHVECSECGATIQYMPEEVEVRNGTDGGGGPSGYKRVKCPRVADQRHLLLVGHGLRAQCPGYGYIERW